MAVFIYCQTQAFTSSFLSQKIVLCPFLAVVGFRIVSDDPQTPAIKITFLMFKKFELLSYFFLMRFVSNVYAFSVQLQRGKDSTVFVAISLRAGRFEARIPLRARYYTFSKTPRPSLGSIQLPAQRGLVIITGGKTAEERNSPLTFV